MSNTTTEMYQGMESGSKPSSRVLAPPGGGSSFSFGSEQPDSYGQQRHTRLNCNKKNEGSNIFAAGDTSPEKHSGKRQVGQHNTSNIFGAPDEPAQPRPAKKETKNNIYGTEEAPGGRPAGKANPAGDGGNPLTGQGYKNGSGAHGGSNRGGFNPITGEAYEAEGEYVSTSAKVHNPQSAHSTRPW